MRTSCAIRPRKGSRVSRRTEASTPCLCNSSTTSPRHFRPNPFLARYQPPPAIAPKIRTTRNRAAVARKRRANVRGRYVGEKSSGFRGWLAAIYFPMLATHVLLAFVTLPLVVLTLIPVFQRRWDKHRRIAKWTMPIWLYVSVTGVLVYLMLYQWFPPPSLAQPR